MILLILTFFFVRVKWTFYGIAFGEEAIAICTKSSFKLPKICEASRAQNRNPSNKSILYVIVYSRACFYLVTFLVMHLANGVNNRNA